MQVMPIYKVQEHTLFIYHPKTHLPPQGTCDLLGEVPRAYERRPSVRRNGKSVTLVLMT